MSNALAWVTSNWQEVASVAALVCMSASTLVGAISGYTKWKGDDKAAYWLKWAHDKLSPFAIGNQEKKAE